MGGRGGKWAYMWFMRSARGEGGARRGEGGGGTEARAGEAGGRRMQRQGRGGASGLERETLRRKPQIHVNSSKRRVPPHPGGLGR